MFESGAAEVWASGAAYEPYVGRWSRSVAREFLQWLALPVRRRWVEVGCGTGALTAALDEGAAPTIVTAFDRSIGYARYARARLRGRPVRFVVADAAQLPVRSGVVEAAVSGLVLNFLPEPIAGIVEMVRVVQVGGTVAAYVWDYAGRMELMRYFWDAAVELDPAAADLDEGRRFPLCDPAALTSLWEAAGLVQVESRAIDIATPFSDFEDYWRPFLGGQGPAPGYVVSLSDERRTTLRERIRERLPALPNGRIELVARAWAVRGRRAA
jgi:SAM-dependent methyltransferase